MYCKSRVRSLPSVMLQILAVGVSFGAARSKENN